MKLPKSLKKLFLLILVIVVSELTIFNFRYYTVKYSGLNHKVIKLNESNLIPDDIDNKDGKKKYLIVLYEKVKGIKFNSTQKDKNEEISITPKFRDESNRYTYKVLDEVRYMPKYKNGEYIVLNSQGKCLLLELDTSSNSDFNIDSIELNTWYFQFNIFRVCILLLVSSIIMFRKEINSFFIKNSKAKIITYICFIVISTILYACYSTNYHKIYESRIFDKGTVLRDIYHEFTSSLIKGKMNLDFSEGNSSSLLTLKNYHDYSERVSVGNPYLYDAAYYKGKFYCYYGITPIITVLLPIALITGKVFYSNLICIIYSTLIMIILLKIYLRLLKYFKIKFGFLLEFLGYLTILLTMELFFLKAIPNFYQAVDLCGMFWLLFATWQIMNLKDNNKIRLFLIGLSYGLMVLTRPLYVFYIVPIIMSVWKYIFKDKRIVLKNSLIFGLPIIIMAIFQMYYNYSRFENVFEFGQVYQITINDTSSLEFDPGIAINGLLSFLFNPPYITRHFPFLGYNNAGVNNGNVIFTEMMFGILCHPFLLILLSTKNRIKNNLKLKKLKYYIFVLFIISVLQLIINVTYAGIIQRYLSDVLPTLTLIALVYWLIYINESKSSAVKKERIKLYKTISVISFVMMSMFMYNCIEKELLDTIHIDKRVISYTITHSLEFYK